MSTTLCDTAAKQGTLETLQMLHSAKHAWGESTMYFAIRHGHLNIVKYLYENKCPFPFSKMYREAVYHGFVDILKYFDSQYEVNRKSKAMVRVAVMARKPNVLQYLYEQGYPFDQSIMTLAVIKNRMECIKFLYTIIERCWFTEKSFEHIGKFGRMELLSFLFEQSRKLDEWDLHIITKEAIEHEKWDILSFLISKECKFSSRTFEAAIESGSLKAVTWIRPHLDTPLTRSIEPVGDLGLTDGALESRGLEGSFLYLAAEYGSVEIIKYLLQQNCPGLYQEAMHLAARFGKFEAFKFLHERTKTAVTHQMVSAAVQSDFLRLLGYIEDNWTSKDTLPWDEQTINWAARYNSIHCFKHMLFNGCPWQVSGVAYIAAQYGSLDVLRYIHEEEKYEFTKKFDCLIHIAKYGEHYRCINYLRSTMVK